MRREGLTPRPDWRRLVEAQGLSYPTTTHPDGTETAYWNEAAAYVLDEDEVTHLEEVTEELHGMCVEAAGYLASGALGGLGARSGAGMRRGTIVTMAPATPLATFVFSCIYRPPFLRLYLRRLRELGLPVADDQLEGRYARWCGDGLELRRGEILILDAPRR